MHPEKRSLKNLFLLCAGIVFCFSFLTAAAREVAKTHSIVTKAGEKYHSVAFPEGSRLEVTDDGRVYYAWPSKDMDLSGHVILAGTQIMISEGGAITSIEQSLPRQKIDDFEIPADTRVSFLNNGSATEIHLKKLFSLRGLEIRDFALLYRDGTFKKITLAREQAVDGIPLREGEITFHANGKLMSGKLSSAAELKAVREAEEIVTKNFPQDTRIYLNDQGILVGAFYPDAGGTEYGVELQPKD